MQYENILKRKALFKTGADLTFIIFIAFAVLLFFKIIPYSNFIPFLLIALCALLVYCRLNFDRSCVAERMSAPIWHYRKDDQNIGPLSLTDIQPMISSGVITNETQVWKEGTKKWTTARSTWPDLFKSIPPTPKHIHTDKASSATVGSLSNISPEKWSIGIMATLVVATLFIPIIGLIFGLINIHAQSDRKPQAKTLVIISCVMFFIYIVLMAASQAIVFSSF